MEQRAARLPRFVGCEIKQIGKLSSLVSRQGSKKRHEKDLYPKYTLQALWLAVSGRIRSLGFEP